MISLFITIAILCAIFYFFFKDIFMLIILFSFVLLCSFISSMLGVSGHLEVVMLVVLFLIISMVAIQGRAKNKKEDFQKKLEFKKEYEYHKDYEKRTGNKGDFYSLDSYKFSIDYHKKHISELQEKIAGNYRGSQYQAMSIYDCKKEIKLSNMYLEILEGKEP